MLPSGLVLCIVEDQKAQAVRSETLSILEHTSKHKLVDNFYRINTEVTYSLRLKAPRSISTVARTI